VCSEVPWRIDQGHNPQDQELKICSRGYLKTSLTVLGPRTKAKNNTANIIKINPYNFELYSFKVGSFFETQCRMLALILLPIAVVLSSYFTVLLYCVEQLNYLTETNYLNCRHCLTLFIIISKCTVMYNFFFFFAIFLSQALEQVIQIGLPDLLYFTGAPAFQAVSPTVSPFYSQYGRHFLPYFDSLNFVAVIQIY